MLPPFSTMVEPPNSMVEEREELMVSPDGEGDPTLRIAHFLKPSAVATTADSLFYPQPHHPPFDLKKSPFTVSFIGWRFPQKKWNSWVDKMHSLHQSTWKKANIYEAIMFSTCGIPRSDELIFGLAERWCCETNTFLFQWGEATITLEDMMVLGGFAVCGDPVSSTLETPESKRIEQTLLGAQHRLGNKIEHRIWMNHFTQTESEVEHEAFLSLWLSRFVFCKANRMMSKATLPIAIHLASGKPLAMAPAVLANIYSDLSMLKVNLVALDGLTNSSSPVLTLTSPLQFVQLWAWERFPSLRPDHGNRANFDPIWARWHNVKPLKVKNVGEALESEADSFQWRPYVVGHVYNCLPLKLYREREEWVKVVDDMSEELLSLIRCLRVSELLGLDCVKQYLPNRVAMQFGMDQDLPVCVARANKSWEMAWSNYTRPIRDTALYVPARLFESDVTIRYLNWRKQSVPLQEMESPCVRSSLHLSKRGETEDHVRMTSKAREHVTRLAILDKADTIVPPLSDESESDDSIDDDRLTVSELLRYKRRHRGKRKAVDEPSDIYSTCPASAGVVHGVADLIKPPGHTLESSMGTKSAAGGSKGDNDEHMGEAENLEADDNGKVTTLAILSSADEHSGICSTCPASAGAVLGVSELMKRPGHSLESYTGTKSAAGASKGGINIEHVSEAEAFEANNDNENITTPAMGGSMNDMEGISIGVEDFSHINGNEETRSILSNSLSRPAVGTSGIGIKDENMDIAESSGSAMRINSKTDMPITDSGIQAIELDTLGTRIGNLEKVIASIKMARLAAGRSHQ